MILGGATLELEKEKRVFQWVSIALEMPVSQRAGFLEEKCGDPQLRAAVMLFLEKSAEDFSLFEKGLADLGNPEDSGIAQANSPSQDFTGQVLQQRYHIHSRLGSGGMGTVYCAHDPRLDRHVALKMLHQNTAENRTRFQREIRAAATLQHPNLVSLFDVDETCGQLFFTMELLKGRTLDRLIPSTGMDEADFFPLAQQIALGVCGIHAQQMVHRDLKPANIMVDDSGHLKILDFGLARHAQPLKGDTTVTQAGQLLGTVAYMSPEQTRGVSLDVRSDLFSMGIVFYEMLTGELPFSGKTVVDQITTTLKEPPKPFPKRLAQLKPLTDFVLVLLAKAPEDRPGDGEEALQRLLACRGRKTTITWSFPVAMVTLVLAIIVLAFWSKSLFSTSFHQRGLDAYERGDLAEAELLLLTAREEDPDLISAYLDLANVYSAQGKFAEAQRVKDEVFTRRDQLPAAHRYRFDGQYQMGLLNYRDALNAFIQAALISPKDDYIQRQMALCYSELGKKPEAQAAIINAVELSDSVFNRGQYALVLVEDNQFTEALHVANLNRQKHPDALFPYWGLGLAHLGNDQFGDARGAFLKWEEGDDFFQSENDYYLANIFIMQGQFQEAVDVLTEGLHLDFIEKYDDYFKRLCWLAQLHLLLGNQQAAQEYLENTAKLQAIPRSVRHLRLATLLAATAHMPDLVAQHEATLTSLVGQYENPHTLGCLSHVRGGLERLGGDPQRARSFLKDAYDQLPDAQTLLSLSLFYLSEGQDKGEATETALKDLHEVVALRGTISYTEMPLVYLLAQHHLASRCLTQELPGHDHQCYASVFQPGMTTRLPL